MGTPGRAFASPQQRPTLGQRVIALTSLVVIFTAFSIAAFVVGTEMQHADVDLAEQGESIAGILAENADFALVARDDPQLRAFARSAFAEPSVRYVGFMNADGDTVVAEARSSGASAPPEPGAETLPRAPGARLVRERPGVGSSDDMLEVIAPIHQKIPPEQVELAPRRPKLLGFVRVSLSRELARQRVRAFALYVVAMTVGLVFLGVVSASLFARRVTRPLQRLQAAAGHVAKGELDVAVAGGGTAEVDGLAAAFNAMVTSLRASRAEVVQRTAQLEAKNDELERFTYTVSHDLKSPLVTITGFLPFIEDAARQGQLDRLRSDIGRIGEAASRMQRLLEELLELSRVGRVVEPFGPVPLGEVVEEAERLVAGRVTERGVRVEIESALPVVLGDRARLLDAFQNLLDNAVKFADPASPLVRVRRRSARDGYATVVVSDNGSGIDPKYEKKVFGLFEKLDADGAGTGIGLALVKRIVEVHGGEVGMESGIDLSGASFIVTLPLAHLDTPPAG